MRRLLQFTIVGIVSAGSYLVGCHHIDIMLKEIAIESGHLWAGSAVHEDTVEDVHPYHLVTQTLDVARLCILQLFPEIIK